MTPYEILIKKYLGESARKTNVEYGGLMARSATYNYNMEVYVQIVGMV